MYGIDVAEVLDTRTWRWMSCRIIGLLETECRVSTHFAPPPDTTARR